MHFLHFAFIQVLQLLELLVFLATLGIAKEISNLQDVINSMSESMQSYASDFSKIRELVSTDLKEISANKKEIFKTIGESQEALQKMYNNMASMSDLIVSKLKRK